jgi:hypothetical protein
MGEHYQAPVLDADMKKRLAAGGKEAIPVVVTFSDAVPASELDALGLYASTTEASQIAYGKLTPDRVRDLAARAGVATIAYAAVLPARSPSTPAAPAAIDKIQSRLRTKLDARPKDKHVVIVYFRGAVSAETLAALDLTEMVDDAGTGRLDKAAVLRLAERPDVRRIEAMPEMRPYR